MTIYVHETQSGENSKELEARKPWIAYWKGDTLKKRLKQERTHEAGLIKTGEMMAKKDALKRKNPTMRVPSSKRNSDSESESYQPSPDSEATESDLAADAELEHDSETEQEADHDAHDEPPPQREIRSKWKNDRPVVGSNEPVNVTQQSVVGPSLGRDDSDNINVEGPVAVPSQSPQKGKEDLQLGHDHETRNDEQLGMEVEGAAVEVPHVMEDNVQEEEQPEPLAIIMPINPEDQSRMATQDLGEHTELEKQTGEHTEVDTKPLNMEMPLEHEDQSKIETDGPNEHTEPEKQTGEHTEVDPKAGSKIRAASRIRNHKIRSKNKKETSRFSNQKPLQCKTPDIAPASIEERCYMWAIMLRNENKFESIFQLRGPNTQEAMRYNFMTMAPETEIDMTTVSVVCHILNREPLERFQRDVYCVPPKILIRMFGTYGTNYINKKTKMPHLVASLKDQQLMELLDKEKLKRSSCLFATVLYNRHWWLYVLDVDDREFYIADFVFGADTSDPERSKLHRFACNILNQLRVWARAQSIIKKRSIALELRAIDVPKQPNPTDCGVYVMKWMEVLDPAVLSGAYAFKTRCQIEEWDQDQLNEFRKEIVSKELMSEHNTLNIEAISQATCMSQEAITEARKRMPRRTKPSAALRSPFLQPSTIELEIKPNINRHFLNRLLVSLRLCYTLVFVNFVLILS
ncbi:hypothetical protein PIB30_029668 [Stylosanthes scabra]|uniref:Ubiquitin-like protease family profile domain-containing protein n=1 Tax=Stylosanthes scabra TaxID=79078 RepID=A0ABU6TD87_9FABA|nr:hypothetical protein [Stylosanthes scabra]